MIHGFSGGTDRHSFRAQGREMYYVAVLDGVQI